MSHLIIFFATDFQSISGQELNETCLLLDNFLDNLNFPLLSTIVIGQGTYYMTILDPSTTWIYTMWANVATYYQQLKKLSLRESLTTGMIIT